MLPPLQKAPTADQASGLRKSVPWAASQAARRSPSSVGLRTQASAACRAARAPSGREESGTARAHMQAHQTASRLGRPCAASRAAAFRQPEASSRSNASAAVSTPEMALVEVASSSSRDARGISGTSSFERVAVMSIQHHDAPLDLYKSVRLFLEKLGLGLVDQLGFLPDEHALHGYAHLVDNDGAAPDLESNGLLGLHGDAAELALDADVSFLKRQSVVGVPNCGRARVLNRAGLVMLHFDREILLSMEEDLFESLLVLETHHVRVLCAVRLVAPRPNPALGAVAARSERRLGVLAVHGTDHHRPIGIPIQERDHHLVADAWQEPRSPPGPRRGLHDADPTGRGVVVLAEPVPPELDLDAPVLVDVDLLARRTGDLGGVEPAHHGPLVTMHRHPRAVGGDERERATEAFARSGAGDESGRIDGLMLAPVHDRLARPRRPVLRPDIDREPHTGTQAGIP